MHDRMDRVDSEALVSTCCLTEQDTETKQRSPWSIVSDRQEVSECILIGE